MLQSRKAKVIALSLGQALTRVVGLAVTMVMARIVVKEDLAAYRQTLLAYATVVPIMGLGVSQAMYYFLPVEKSRIRGRLLDGVAVTGLIGLLFAIFLALGGNDLLAQRFSNPKIAHMLLWMIPYAILTTPAKLASSVFVARDRVVMAAIFGVCQQLLIGFSTVIPLILWHTVEASLLGNIAASILMASMALILMIRSTPNDSSRPTTAGVIELTQFAVPLALAGMFGTISMQLDKWIVSFLCGPDEFAVYALGAMEVPLIGMVTGAMTAVALTDMRKAVDAGKPADALRLFQVIARKSSYVILPIMLFFMLTADTVIQYLYGSDYADSAIPFRIYLVLLPVRTVVFGSLILALGKSRFILFRSMIGLVINGILSVFLVWHFGPWGASIATVTAIYLWSLPANLYVLSRELNTSFSEILPFGTMYRICFAIAPLAIISVLILSSLDNCHQEFIAIVLCFTLYLAVYWNRRLYSISDVMSRLARLRQSE